ncbi:DNA repair photolyase [Ruminiclostridium sufflavum DSM 19573]|uniref:DNA repair photolyase n=1 Tax=Ruminiclostridium sufflavum DSM 19573 TaxID=1121337 RepID=A0A318XKP5_9FIRM|nr:radical SAM protein [Ruminiclostridium sufflavum]PYG88015.1 DNA repair photolyase [Ruminiclostridium sufflavum DSM 19573]
MIKEECKSLLYRIRPQGPVFKFYPHRATLNYYIGCSHGCKYCYACYTMKNIGLEPEDFAKEICLKSNAIEVLNKELGKKAWKAYSGITHLGTIQDPYQPIELELGYTRKVLEIFLENGIPTTILTKSPLIERDIDILKEMATRNLVHVDFSIAYLNEMLRSILEPGTQPFEERFRTLEKLRDNGISTGIFINPVIPVYTGKSLEKIIARAKDCGVKYVLMGFIHLIGSRYKEMRGLINSINPSLNYDKYFNFSGRRVVMEKNARMEITKYTNQLSVKYGVPFITTEFHQYKTGDYNFGVFTHRHPLIFDYVDLLARNKNKYLGLDDAIEFANGFNCEKSYFSSLKWYWNSEKMFNDMEHLNIQRRVENDNVQYMLAD